MELHEASKLADQRNGAMSKNHPNKWRAVLQDGGGYKVELGPKLVVEHRTRKTFVRPARAA